MSEDKYIAKCYNYSYYHEGLEDISILGSTHVILPPGEVFHPVRFILRLDGVAQEGNETFSLSISNLDLQQITTFIDTMNGTIVDSDGMWDIANRGSVKAKPQLHHRLIMLTG